MRLGQRVQGSRLGRTTGEKPIITKSEIEHHLQAREAWTQQRLRCAPWDTVCISGVEVLVASDRVVVEQVVDVNADVQALVGEPDVLGELEVEERVPFAVEITRIEQVDEVRRRRD